MCDHQESVAVAAVEAVSKTVGKLLVVGADWVAAEWQPSVVGVVVVEALVTGQSLAVGIVGAVAEGCCDRRNRLTTEEENISVIFIFCNRGLHE